MNPERLSRQPEALIPMVIETTNRGERGVDIYSRLLRDRLITMRYVRPRVSTLCMALAASMADKLEPPVEPERDGPKTSP